MVRCKTVSSDEKNKLQTNTYKYDPVRLCLENFLDGYKETISSGYFCLKTKNREGLEFFILHPFCTEFLPWAGINMFIQLILSSSFF